MKIKSVLKKRVKGRRMWGKRFNHTLLVGMQIGATIMERRFLRKLGMEPPFDPVIPLLGLYPKDLKPTYYSDAATSMFIAAQFTIARIWNQPTCPQQLNG